MAVKFNPFTGQLQIDEKGSGGGSSYIDGEVATYADLPLDGSAALNSAWLVRTASGVWPVSRKQAGIYIRTATAGVSRDADFTYAGTMPDVFSDAVLTIYDEASTTRTGQFNLGSITAGQNRVLTWPDASGTLVLGNDTRIANIAANSITTAQGANSGGAGGTITMRGGITGAEGAGGNAGSINLRGSDDRGEGVFHGGSIDLSAFSGTGGNITSTGNSEGAGGSLNMSGNGFAGGSINTSGGSNGVGGSIDTSNDGGSINTRGTGLIGFGESGTRTTVAGTATANRSISLPDASGTLALTSELITGAAASASDVLGVSGSDITGVDAGSDKIVFWDDSASELTYLATVGPTFDGTNLRWPVELIIACSDETSNLTTGTAKVTFRAPYAFLLTAVRASVNTAPTGSTLIVDINNGANSALSTKLSIDASEKTSTTAATAAVIDTAYDDFSDDAEITIDIDQIGSTIAGKGLKVTLIGTRA